MNRGIPYFYPVIQSTKKSYPSLRNHHFYCLLLVLSGICSRATAQQLTGYWKGKIDRKKVELKIVKNGDSITGTSYYYDAPGNYRRYSIKGYFDGADNSVVWWDDELIDEKTGSRLFSGLPAKPRISSADFSCPGTNKMFLNGKAALKEKEDGPTGPVDLQKSGTHLFKDEWDFIIDNYTVGANDPYLIDSVGKLAFVKPISPSEPAAVDKPEAPPVAVVKSRPVEKPIISTKKEPAVKPVIEKVKDPVTAAAPLSIEEKFETRSKIVLKEIPVMGDSIELQFYDNAEVDGDSISIFLNGQLIARHIRLTEKAHVIKLSVKQLQQTNDLVMVAENLGSIPPNTSYMVVIVDGNRYGERLESSEQSSASIRFIKPPAPVSKQQ